jgi:hypothetical protein
MYIDDVVGSTRKDRVHILVAHMLDPENSNQIKLDLWKELVQIKRSARVGWERLGVHELTVNAMLALETLMEPNTQKRQTYSQRILQLASITPMTSMNAHSIMDIKRKAKKGWRVLKVPVEVAFAVEAILSSK